MKSLAALVLLHLTASLGGAGEAALTTTYQPLDGLGSGEITIVAVTCHHVRAGSVGSAVDLIHLRNVPPTDIPKFAKDDLNLASLSGLRFSTHDLGDPEAKAEILLDATRFDPSKANGYEKEDIVRASLECLRRCLPEVLTRTPVTLKSTDAQRPWIDKIVTEFNNAPRDQPFFEPS